MEHLNAVIIIIIFTFLIHFSEASVYMLRLAGIRTRRLATALSFITSALLISRLSNMMQAPFLGNLVDISIQSQAPDAFAQLIELFRIFIFSACIGSLAGALVAPTMYILLQYAITKFEKYGSFIQMIFSVFLPRHLIGIIRSIRMPRPRMLHDISFKNIPKGFLVLNVLVTSIYTIGVLCSLLAAALLPDLRATAIMLSGIVNGLATILMATVVDPKSAQITDQAYQGTRPISDVKSVVFGLLVGRIFGTLIIAQILLIPFTHYIAFFTKIIAKFS